MPYSTSVPIIRCITSAYATAKSHQQLRFRRDDVPMATPASIRGDAERWFLDNGLPSVLTRRARWHGLWPRSAPVLAGFAALMVVALVIHLLVGNVGVDIEGTPNHRGMDRAGRVGPDRAGRRRHRVAGVAAAEPFDAVSRIHGQPGGGDGERGVQRRRNRRRGHGARSAVCAAANRDGPGLGAGLGRQTCVTQLAAVGQLMLRALPVVLLTVLVFFNSPVWLMAASVGRRRLWLAMLFLGTIAAAFLITSTFERIRPMLRAVGPEEEGDGNELAGTPFAGMAAPAATAPLTRPERFNVVFVMLVSQLVQVLTVAVVTTLIFFVLGLILLNPALLAAWTRNGSSDGKLLWMTIPVPDALIQVALFLGALTFMYLSARAVGDRDYRSQFLDPLIEDLRLTLMARNRYRAATAP